MTTHPQSANLRRVSANLSAYVLAFVGRCGQGGTFRLAELTAYVTERHGSAPSSPDRILRDLRAKGQLDYEVTDRAASMYRVTAAPQRQMVLL